MALQWTDKRDFVDTISAAHVNSLAHAIKDNESSITAIESDVNELKNRPSGGGLTNIPVASNSQLGGIKLKSYNGVNVSGINVAGNGEVTLNESTEEQIEKGENEYTVVTPRRLKHFEGILKISRTQMTDFPEALPPTDSSVTMDKLATDVKAALGGGSGGNVYFGKKYATRVIGNSASGYTSNDVDYLISGSTDASTAIKNAIAGLPSNGGKIVFLEGTYSVTSAVTVSKNVVFEGMGDGTKINVTGRFITTNSAVTVTLRDLAITATSVGDGIIGGGSTSNMPYVTLDNCHITATKSTNNQMEFPYALIMYCDGIKICNSNISLTITSAVSSPGCYAIAEIPTDSNSRNYVCVSNSRLSITVNAADNSVGDFNAYVVRKGALISNCDIYLTGKSNKAKAAGGADYTFFSTCRFFFNNQYCVDAYGGDASTRRFYVFGSSYYSKVSFTLSGKKENRIGCIYDNIYAQ